jgi:hypothetical protein
MACDTALRAADQNAGAGQIRCPDKASMTSMGGVEGSGYLVPVTP